MQSLFSALLAGQLAVAMTQQASDDTQRARSSFRMSIGPDLCRPSEHYFGGGLCLPNSRAYRLRLSSHRLCHRQLCGVSGGRLARTANTGTSTTKGKPHQMHSKPSEGTAQHNSVRNSIILPRVPERRVQCSTPQPQMKGAAPLVPLDLERTQPGTVRTPPARCGGGFPPPGTYPLRYLPP